jgi:5-methylcytosine-specific restriction endonuclease McrA
LAQKQFSKKIRSEFSQSRFENWDINRDAENNLLREFVKVNNLESSHYYKYQEYLRSPQWKEKRVLVMARDNNTCQHCKNTTATEIHHVRYDNIFDEPLEDLISLCNLCHSQAHKKGSIV